VLDCEYPYINTPEREEYADGGESHTSWIGRGVRRGVAGVSRGMALRNRGRDLRDKTISCKLEHSFERANPPRKIEIT